jgi:Holliday junction resolvase RusA-like endonuclease
MQAEWGSGTPPLACALRVHILAYLGRPKSHYGTGKNAGKLKPSAPRYPEVKPDVDNIVKFVYDALTGICWDDDKRIIGGESLKDYADDGPPRVEIWIEEL